MTVARRGPGSSPATSAPARHADSDESSADHLSDELESIARIGWYSLDLPSGRWVSSSGLDAILGIDATFDRSVSGWASLVHPGDREAMLAYLAGEVLGRGRPFDRHYRIVSADTGEERWVHGRGALEVDAAGRPLRMLGTIADVTDQRRAEEALIRSELRYAAIFEGTSQAILIADVETKRFRWANPAACALLGYARDELLELTVHDIHPAQDLPATLGRFKAIVDGRGTVARSVPSVRKDGTPLLADIKATAAVVDGVACSIAFFTDVTELRAAESELAGEFRERAQVAAALARLQPGESAEATAAAICDGLLGLPGVAMAEVGIRAVAYAPIRNGGGLLGVVAAGTRDEAYARHLVDHLPAVGEFAATAGALLGRQLERGHRDGLVRERVMRAMAQRGLRPVFQPIVALGSAAVVGYEALARFADGTPPHEMIAGAHSVGLGLDLEVACLAAALEAADALPRDAWLSLNVSPEVLLRSRALAGLVARRSRPIVIEVTEHAAIDDYPAVRRAIEALGPTVRLAVDDAGAGFASLRHVVELRPTFLKLDVGLVRHVDRDLTRQAMIAGMRHFAARVGGEVVAEGIEEAAELEMLRELGVPLGQGHLLGRPAPVPARAGDGMPRTPPRRRRVDGGRSGPPGVTTPARHPAVPVARAAVASGGRCRPSASGGCGPPGPDRTGASVARLPELIRARSS